VVYIYLRFQLIRIILLEEFLLLCNKIGWFRTTVASLKILRVAVLFQMRSPQVHPWFQKWFQATFSQCQWLDIC